MLDVIDLLEDGDLKPHSSVTLTYDLDLTLYDGLIRRALKTAGVTNQVVFCDFRQHQAELDGIGNARHFGREYSVTPVLQAGAFHPKVYLLLGRTTGRLVIGSGNATTGGLLRNAELFGSFDFSQEKAPPHKAFQDVWRWILELSRNASPHVREQLRRASEWSPWLHGEAADDGRRILIGGPGHAPLRNQIEAILSGHDISGAVTCSASFDRKLAGLSWLTKIAGSVDCVVSPSRINVDGKSVTKLSDRVRWHPFVDPVAHKGGSRDNRLHGKLIVFCCGDHELVFFGSANASSPAWLEAGNSECVVSLPERATGTTIARLGLRASLEANTVEQQLQSSEWLVDDGDTFETLPLLLGAASVNDGTLSLTVLRGVVPKDATLRFIAGRNGTLLLSAPVIVHDGGVFVTVAMPEKATLVYLSDPGGVPMSNDIGITWPDVTSRSPSMRMNERVTHAIESLMIDGMVLGLTLFELLNQMNDFEVVRGGGRSEDKATSSAEEPDGSDIPFYTDTISARHANTPAGDKIDLEILATLIQPLKLRTTSSALWDAKVTEDEDDDAIEEEAARRALDAKPKKQAGAGRNPAGSKPTRDALESASRRLVRRLGRAATSLYSALGVRKGLKNISSSAVARQLWMLQIAAALAGKEMETSDGTLVECLEPLAFADYVLRIGRAFSGGKDGGLLDLVKSEDWERDGALLRAGLEFLWTCMLWASALTVRNWRHDSELEYAKGLHAAAPELVCARFVVAAARVCAGPDRSNICRRLPAWDVVGFDDESNWLHWQAEIGTLADTLKRLDTGSLLVSSLPTTTTITPGQFAYTTSTGMTVVVEVLESHVELIDLSEPDDKARRKFIKSRVCPIIMTSLEKGPTWRPTKELSKDVDC